MQPCRRAKLASCPARPGRAGRQASAVVGLAVSLLALPCSGQDAARLHQRSLAASCAQCHGTDGRPPEGSPLAPLAGMAPDTFLARMRALQADAAPGAVMPQIARGYSEARLRELAAYFAALSR